MTPRALRSSPAPGRNAACPCGSGRKYKHCCALAATPPASLENDFARAELKRGAALERAGRIDEAMVAYELAAAELPQARSRLAELLEGLGRVDEAIGCFRAAAGAAPTSPERRMDLVMALMLEDRLEEAEVQLREVLAVDPNLGEAHALLGRILAESGRFDAAADCFLRALALEPGKAGRYYHLVRTRRLTEADRPLIHRMIAAARSVTLVEERLQLHLAIAKALDDLADHGGSMRQIVKANAIRKTLSAFDGAALARHVDDLIALFTPDFLARHAERGDPSRRPVLIVGMPRSGTTLIEQILSSHPDVAGAGELRFWPSRDAAMDRLGAGAWIGARQAALAKDCLDALWAIAPHALRVIDKNPFNFFCLGLFHVVFPEATIIHCRRHAIDTCLSITSTHITARGAFPADLDDLVVYYRQYARLMAHWRASLPRARFVEVDYEAVVADPEPQSRRLVAALGLDWDASCLRPERNPRAVKTSSAWQVRQPIHGASVERWRRYEPWLGPLGALATD
jgi:tetratricopeptide (TPR) repeat protein